MTTWLLLLIPEPLDSPLSISIDITLYFAILDMKGCRRASCGVHLFSGLRARQRSNKSAKRLSSFVSPSLNLLVEESSRVRRSRVGCLNANILTVS